VGSGAYPHSDIVAVKYSSADGSILWRSSYSGQAPANDAPTSALFDGAGNVVITGTSDFDYYTAKYSATDGRLLWEKRYDGADGLQDIASAMVIDRDGNVIVTGSTELALEGYRASDIYTVKYASASGEVLWSRRYDGPDKLSDGASSIAVDASGDVLIAGYSHMLHEDLDLYVAKYAAVDGALLWERRYDGPFHRDDRATTVRVDQSGDVIITGNSIDHPSRYFYANYTAKYAGGDGALLWERRSTAFSAETIALGSEGSVVLLGTAGTNLYLGKLGHANGVLEWEVSAGGTNAPRSGRSVLIDSLDNIFATGSSPTIIRPSGPGIQPRLVWTSYLAKYSKEGNLLWRVSYNGMDNGSQTPEAIAFDSNEDVLMTTYRETNTVPVSGTMTLVKFSSNDGNVIWQTALDHPPQNGNVAYANGRLVVNGRLIDSGLRSDIGTALYEDDLSPYLRIGSLTTDQLRVLWPPHGRGWQLERLAGEFGTNGAWLEVPGSRLTNSAVIPLDRSKPSEFFRLRAP
jgi:hypothetical protein